MSNEIIVSLENISEIAYFLIDKLPENVIIFLDGEVGAGKTTLVQEIAKKFNINDSVTSPTFSLQQQYGDKLFHYDLYRLDDDEFLNLGLHEELDKDGWHLIEWGGSKLKEFLKIAGYNTSRVTILPHDNDRLYIIGDECIL
jgi:tRNA threonylcarbamoyladenosine biosynthesis protein TsaE